MSNLAYFESLKSKKDFSIGYNEGRKWHCEGVLIFYLSKNCKKVGFIASKKVGNAVTRNRAKRRMRAVFLEIQNEIKDGIYIFVAKPSLQNISYKETLKNVRWACKRLDCLSR